MKRTAIVGLVSVLVMAFGLAVVQPSPAQAAQCWNQFDPPAPQGAAMTQTFKNCNLDEGYFMPYFTLGGSRYIFNYSCTRLRSGDSAVWYHPSTQAGSLYDTALCRPDYAPTSSATWHSSGNERCWTSFNPPAPQGGPMDQYYVDCSGYAQTPYVAPAFVTRTALHAYDQHCRWLPPDWDEGRPPVGWWYFPATVRDVNYTTVICTNH